MSKPRRPKQLSRQTIYESDWINLHLDDVEFPGGRIIKGMHVLDYPKEAVGAIVQDSRKRILLEYAYRYHTGADGWEIPAGAIDEKESIIKAAQREIQEETGYDSKNHELLYSFNPSNGSSNLKFHIVRCEAVGNPGEFDRNEVRESKWFSEQEALALIKNKEIHDAFTPIALLMHMYVF